MKTVILKQKELIEYLKDKDDTKLALISFSDEGDDSFDLSNYKNLQYIKCSIDDLWYDEIKDEKVFNEVFNNIGKFIVECHNKKIDTIICQCVHGESRSAACAAAINEYYNHDGIIIFADYKYSPNQYFYNKIYESIKLYSKN